MNQFISQNFSRKSFIKLLALAAVSKNLLPETMEKNTDLLKRKIPGTDESIPVIGLGTWKTFDKEGTEANVSLLSELTNRFHDLGGRVIDSSPMYGRAEENIGKIAPYLEDRTLFYATKVWTRGESSGKKQIQASFSGMQTKLIDLLQIHNLVDWKIHIKTLKKLKEEGNIRYIGITHYHSGAFPDMESIMKSENIDFIQIPYSVVTREAENRLLPLALEKNIAVLVNRPFEEGSLFSYVKGKSLPENAEDFGIKSWAQLFLKFILAEEAVTCIIPATAKIKHLEDNISAGKGNIPDKKTREEWTSRIL